MSNFAIILKKSSTYLLPILTGKGDIGEVTAGPEIPAHKDGRGGDDHSDDDDDHGDGDDQNMVSRYLKAAAAVSSNLFQYKLILSPAILLLSQLDND